MRLVFHAAGFAFHFALLFLRKMVNKFLLSVNQFLSHTQSKGLQGKCVVFSVTVPAVENSCVFSIRGDIQTSVNQQSVFGFLFEVEAGAVIISTTISVQQLNKYALSRLLLSH
jgi:hypothetical protein